MKNKIVLFAIVLIMSMLYSCRTNSTRSNDNGSSSDSGSGGNESSEGFGFKVYKDSGARAVFLTTSDGSRYYLYDDEIDYSDYFFLFFIACNATRYTDEDYNLTAPYINSVFDVPNLHNVPEKVKAKILDIYYDKKDQLIYKGQQSYGKQTYYFDLRNGHFPGWYTFARYKKKPNDGFDDVPDGALMFFWWDSWVF